MDDDESLKSQPVEIYLFWLLAFKLCCPCLLNPECDPVITSGTSGTDLNDHSSDKDKRENYSYESSEPSWIDSLKLDCASIEQGKSMQQFSFIILVVLNHIVTSVSSIDCDLFQYGPFCSLDPMSNIIQTIPSLENESKCQAECTNTAHCNFFMFIRFKDAASHSSCFLLQDCQTNSSSSCTDDPSCLTSTIGPVSPPILDACCSDLAGMTCQDEFIVGQEESVFTIEECRQLCIDNGRCQYWSLKAEESCILFSECGQPEPCLDCSTGPRYPDPSLCQSPQNVFALLMGGETSNDRFSTSMEMITPNKTKLENSISFDSIPLQALLGFFKYWSIEEEKSIQVLKQIAFGKEIWILLEFEFSSFWADL